MSLQDDVQALADAGGDVAICPKCGKLPTRCTCEEDWQAERLRARTELLEEMRRDSDRVWFCNCAAHDGTKCYVCRVDAELAKDAEHGEPHPPSQS